jgi:hypothetical protein
MLNPSFSLSFSIYMLAGVVYFYWSEPYRPLSKAIFDHVSHLNRGLWVVMVFLVAAIWPICALHMAYRCFFTPKKEKEAQDAGR